MAHLSRMSTACSAHYIRYLLSKSCCSTEPHWVDWWASIFWKIFLCWISNAASFWPAQGKPHLSSPPLPTPERLPYQLLSVNVATLMHKAAGWWMHFHGHLCYLSRTGPWLYSLPFSAPSTLSAPKPFLSPHFLKDKSLIQLCIIADLMTP